MSDFKVGDVVKLKSGGPDMTINRIEDVNHFRCVWFSAMGLHTLGFLRLKDWKNQDPDADKSNYRR